MIIINYNPVTTEYEIVVHFDDHTKSIRITRCFLLNKRYIELEEFIKNEFKCLNEKQINEIYLNLMEKVLND